MCIFVLAVRYCLVFVSQQCNNHVLAVIPYTINGFRWIVFVIPGGMQMFLHVFRCYNKAISVSVVNRALAQYIWRVIRL